MFRAMVLKELRETRAIFLVALAAFTYLFVSRLYPWLQFGRSQVQAPFVLDTFLGWFSCIAAAMAIGLGLRQTIGESIGGTYSFLYHRPAQRGWLIGMKLLVGVFGSMLCSALPIVAYGIWASTPGTHPSPFDWSMTVPTWLVWLAMPLPYFGAFLTGFRPGSWWRSRLLPLIAAGTMTIMAIAIAVDRERPFVALFVIGVSAVVALSSILFVTFTRDSK